MTARRTGPGLDIALTAITSYSCCHDYSRLRLGTPLLELSHVSKWYGDGPSRFHALTDVSLTVSTGESVAVVGRSGSGKSTLMHVAALLDTPDEGTLLVDGEDASRLSTRQVGALRNRRFGFVFQQFFLDPSTSVLANVVLPLTIAGVPGPERRRRGMAVLEQFDLADKAGNRATALSGGQKQRAVLCRALVGQPDVVFADEPTGNLDTDHRGGGRGRAVLAGPRPRHHAGRGHPRRGAGRALRPPGPRARRPGRHRAGGRLMRAADLVRTAVGNTFRSRLRTTLTVLALVVGSSTLTLTTALGAGVTDYVTRQVDALGADDVLVVTAAGQDTGEGPVPYDPERSVGQSGAGAAPLPGAGGGGALTDADLADLAAVEGLSDIEPLRTVTVDYVAVEGSDDPEARYELSIAPTSSIARSDLAAGEQLDAAGDRAEVVLPEEYVDALGLGSADEAVGTSLVLAVTDVLGEQHELGATLVGVSNPSLLASGAGANTALVEELADLQAGGVEQPARYAVATARFDPDLSDDQVTALKDDVATAGMTGQTIADQLGIVTTVIGGITGVLSAFAVVALLAAAFGIVNTLLMSVQERTREIGLMKAMGMSSGRVFGLFSLEAAFIGLLGSGLGVLLAVGIGTPLSATLADGPLAALGGLQVLVFEPLSLLGVVALIVAVAFAAGTLPARAAARKSPIDALRYE